MSKTYPDWRMLDVGKDFILVLETDFDRIIYFLPNKDADKDTWHKDPETGKITWIPQNIKS